MYGDGFYGGVGIVYTGTVVVHDDTTTETGTHKER